MGCNSSAPVAVPPAATDKRASVAVPSMMMASGKMVAPRLPSLVVSQQDILKRKAMQFLNDNSFWQDEAFTELSLEGKPRTDAEVVKLLAADQADTRMQRAAARVYAEVAASEWGSELTELAGQMPLLGGVLGIMADIAVTFQIGRQVNRHNCKLLQEAVRSSALVLAAACRSAHGPGFTSTEDTARPVLLELIRVLAHIRSLLSNYAHSSMWVRLLVEYKQDKTRFEGLHACLEELVSNLLAALLPTTYPWTAPACDYNAHIERLVLKAVELTGQRQLLACLKAVLESEKHLATLAVFAGIDAADFKVAVEKQVPHILQSPTQPQLDRMTSERVRMMEVRSKEARAQFSAIKAAAAAPKVHSTLRSAKSAAALQVSSSFRKQMFQEQGLAERTSLPTVTAGDRIAANRPLSAVQETTSGAGQADAEQKDRKHDADEAVKEPPLSEGVHENGHVAVAATSSSHVSRTSADAPHANGPCGDDESVAGDAAADNQTAGTSHDELQDDGHIENAAQDETVSESTSVDPLLKAPPLAASRRSLPPLTAGI